MVERGGFAHQHIPNQTGIIRPIVGWELAPLPIAKILPSMMETVVMEAPLISAQPMTNKD